MAGFTYSPLIQRDEIRVLTLYPDNGKSDLEGSIKHIRLPAIEPSPHHIHTQQIDLQPSESQYFNDQWAGPEQDPQQSPTPQVATHSSVWNWNFVQSGDLYRLKNNGREWVIVNEPKFQFHCSRQGYGKRNYDALSYSWGDPTKTEIIAVDGKCLGIASNLHAALTRMRSLTEPRRIWVDAICIDQENILERNHQVQMMKRVFSCASSVIVWLGTSSGNAASTLDMILDFNASPGRKNIFKYNENSLNGLTSVFRRPWWRRIWIVQEVVAARELVILLGHTIFPWEFLAKLCRTIELDEFRQQPLAPILRSCGYQKFTTLHNFRQSRAMQLVRLLQCTQGYQASDPRDKLYALLGLSSDVSTDDFPPDYSKPVQRVWEDLVKFMALQRNRLDIVSSAHLSVSGPGIPDLQSWLPCWHSPSTLRPLNGEPTSRYSYSAAGNTQAVVDLSQFPHVLGAEGIVADTVEIFGGSITIGHECLSTIRRWQYIASQRIDSSTMDCFWRVIVADKDHTGNHATEYFGRGFNDFINGSRKVPSRCIQNFSDAVTRAVMGRRFFITRKGRLGLAPPVIQLKDRIVILKGCCVPLILRAVGDSSVLIGEAYVSGIMDGELISGLEAGRYKPRMIHLK